MKFVKHLIWNPIGGRGVSQIVASKDARAKRVACVRLDVRAQLVEQQRCLEQQTEMRVQLLQDLQDFFRKKAEIETEYSRNLEKLAERFMAKTRSTKDHQQYKYRQPPLPQALPSSDCTKRTRASCLLLLERTRTFCHRSTAGTCCSIRWVGRGLLKTQHGSPVWGKPHEELWRTGSCSQIQSSSSIRACGDIQSLLRARSGAEGEQGPRHAQRPLLEQRHQPPHAHQRGLGPPPQEGQIALRHHPHHHHHHHHHQNRMATGTKLLVCTVHTAKLIKQRLKL